MKTVIVDDDYTSRCWLRGVVTKLGFAVVAEAANGEEAVRAVERAQPDLVLLDVSMPIQPGRAPCPRSWKPVRACAWSCSLRSPTKPP